jgi:capsule polysaccharide modification protein KpsS
VESLQPEQVGAFDAYRRRLRQGQLESKFAQRQNVYRLKLIASGQIPFGKYVFFPLQIPHDQSIRYFSDYTEEDVVRAVLEWSARSGVAVVFKPHPVNKKSMATFAEMVNSANAYWSTANVQDLIKHAAGVFTINSGVGFEALLHLKPVVTFGRAEYDCVCFKGNLENIADAWRYCLDTPPLQLEHRYQVFVDWFLSSHAIDLSRPEQASRRFDAIAKSVLAEIWA